MLILPLCDAAGLGVAAFGAALGALARLLAPEDTLGIPPPTFEIPPILCSLQKCRFNSLLTVRQANLKYVLLIKLIGGAAPKL